MSSSRFLLALSLFVLVFATAGCGDMVRVVGKVTYADGTPLTVGQIVFTDDFYMGKSDLDKNGEYSIHTRRRNDGIKKGTYRVYITGAIRFENTPDSQFKEEDLYTGRAPEIKSIDLIDAQYTNPDTTGWVYELKKNSKIDFVVYPPGKVPEDQRTEMAKYFFDEEYRAKVKKERERENPSSVPTPPKRRRTVNPKLL